MPAPNGSLYPSELILLAASEVTRHVKRGPEIDPTTKMPVIRLYKGDATAGDTGTIVAQTELEARMVQAARIMFAESGGDPAAVCYNYQKPNGDRTCSKTPLPAGTPGTERGVDRGLWQFNSKAFPKITDLCAFEVDCAMKAAYHESNGFTAWGPWSKSAGIDPKAERYDNVKQVVETAWADMQGTAIAEDWLTQPIVGLGGAIKDGAEATFRDMWDAVLAGAPDWVKGLFRAIGYVFTQDFWRRFGMGALGVGMILVALVLVVAETKLGR